MRRTASAISIAILRYPGAQEAAVLGLRDLLETASRLHAGARPGRLEVAVVDAECGPPEPEAPLTVLVLPPSLGPDPRSDWPPRLLAWIRARHRDGTLVCSVCAGAFLLAATGLLAGRRATTHWGLGPLFAARFPDVALDTDALLVDDGDVVTAGGLMAWVDLGLGLVGRLLGPTAQLGTARTFLVDPGGREQRFYRVFSPPLGHGDAAVREVQLWLQGRHGTPVTVPALASRAGLGERTFLRRFARATGLTPLAYLQHLRVGKARELLELSDAPVDEVAWRVGYGDPSAFRKLFLRVVGISPGEYRRRFGVSRRALPARPRRRAAGPREPAPPRAPA